MSDWKSAWKRKDPPNQPCDCCGSPVPDCYALCFVCLSDERGRRIRELEAKLRVVNELKPLNKWDVEEALAEDDSLLFISYDELRVKLDELEALLK